MAIERCDLPAAYVWDLSYLYPSVGDWEVDMQRLEQERNAGWPRMQSFHQKLTGVEAIGSALQEYFGTQRAISKVYTYAHLRHDEDLSNAVYSGLYERARHMEQSFTEAAAWLASELITLDEKLWKQLFEAASLAPYRQWLRQLHRCKTHVLPHNEARLMAMGETALASPQKAFSALTNVDLQFGEVLDQAGQARPLTHGLYQVYMRDQDRVLRQNAFERLFEVYRQHLHVLTQLLLGDMHRQLFHARAHRYTSCLDAALSPKAIPQSVYTELLKVVHEYAGTLHRYMELRKQVLGVETLHAYDLHVPLVQEVHLEIPYEQACAWVIESVAPLGAEYQGIVRRGLLEEHWVDVEETKGKRSGAYSSGCYDSPPYILMNYRGSLQDVFTLAHEVGHSMHSYLSNRNNEYASAHYPIFVAEVASTLNEQLLFDLLLKKLQTPQQQLYLLNQKLEEIRSTLFRQALFAEFELWLHQQVEAGVPVSTEALNEKYQALCHQYYGHALHPDQPLAWEWARIPHFYYDYYVYQYSTGLSCALALHERILKEGQAAVEDYLKFLRSGGSQYPIDLLEQAGVSIRHGEAVRTALQTFDLLVNRLAKQLL